MLREVLTKKGQVLTNFYDMCLNWDSQEATLETDGCCSKQSRNLKNTSRWERKIKNCTNFSHNQLPSMNAGLNPNPATFISRENKRKH
jgi:hypothetical protein